MKKSHRIKSLALIELVLAISIASVIFLAIHTVFGLSMGIYRKTKAPGAFDAQEAFEKIAFSLRNAYIVSDKDSEILFKGNVNTIQFVSVSSLKDVYTKKEAFDLRGVLFSLVKDDGKNVLSLLKRTKPFSKKYEKKETIIDGITFIKFSYFDGKRWVNSWDSNIELPKAVSVSLKFQKENSGGYTGRYSMIVEIPCAQ